MKKILFLSHSLDIAGAQLILKNIVINLDKSLFSPQIWAPYNGELKTDYENSKIPVNIRDFFVDKINRDQKITFSTRTIKKIKKLINKCIKNREKLAIRCAGSITEKILAEFDFSNVDLVGIFDNNLSLSEINGYKIYPVKDIDKFNIDNVLIAHCKPNFFKNELSSYNFKIIENFFSDSFSEKILKTIKYLILLKEPSYFFSKIEHDILFINNARNFWAVIAGKLLGKKVIWAIHENFAPKTFKVFPEFLYFLSFKLADKFIFPSSCHL